MRMFAELPMRMDAPADGVARACCCVGPQNGNPVCPCMMPEHNRQKMADMALGILTRGRPRIRVKAGRQVVPL